MTTEEMPTWRLRENLRRQAEQSIEGRAAFERHHWKSAKPLTPIQLDPRYVVQLLDALDEAERLKEEYHEQWMLYARELEQLQAGQHTADDLAGMNSEKWQETEHEPVWDETGGWCMLCLAAPDEDPKHTEEKK